MGLFDKLSSILSLKKKTVTLLVIGLDNSGKSSMINCLKPPASQAAVVQSTLGFTQEQFNVQDAQFIIYDMSGQSCYRNLWEHYYREVDAICFVVDSSDRLRYIVARDELETMLGHAEIKQRNLPILFFANKCDAKNAASGGEIKHELDIDKLCNGGHGATRKPYQVFESNSLTGDGVLMGFSWLSIELDKKSNS